MTVEISGWTKVGFQDERHTVIHTPQTFAHQQEHCTEMINIQSLFIRRGHLRIGLFAERLISAGLGKHWSLDGRRAKTVPSTIFH